MTEAIQHGLLADSPAALLRRVAAERKLLAEHRQTAGMGDTDTGYDDMPSVCTRCGTADEYGVDWPCRTVLLLAEAWGWTEELG